ncbi:bleomycin resistance protein [Dyella acidiphila]|uniref:Bleomycin resistance protein n=1 Tax=Dyella acidiphila TaxID=2775866 RepID=A0ABR9GEP1_9GAMM|nr:VOC family protein [Dyella acidiphila]MBE1162509.1 VOC family protein [Dyella acidiphila]
MLIPILSVRDVTEAIGFYTGVLDFRVAFAWPEQRSIYAGLVRGEDELHLALAAEHGRHGHGSAVVLCDDVDALFASFKAKGLALPSRAGSPVHEAPLDQSWGTREVYIDDPSGNTLVFQQRRQL